MVIENSVSDVYIDESITFASLQLDLRLLQSLNHNGFHHPTLVQSSAIPLALQQKRDIILKAATGSGKTLAYLIPVVQTILDFKKVAADITGNCTLGIIMVPSRDLARQVHSVLEKLVLYCMKEVRVLNLSSDVNESILESLLHERPEIIICTPTKLLSVLEGENSNKFVLEELKFLVIDEVDLILTFGYQEDLLKISSYLPLRKNLQTFLMSATLNDDIQELKAKFSRSPAILKLNEDELNKDQKKLIQYYVNVSEFDKFLLCYVIFKLNLIKGKTIVFVNTIDRGYRLKLVLQQFGIRSCILNGELPSNSREHIVEQFNKNFYSLLIATDDTEYIKDDNEYLNDAEESTEDPSATTDRVSKHEVIQKDKEYGASRGIDFKNVSCVLNFDLPTSAKSYLHRIGRTARAGKSGTAISFVVPQNEFGKHKPSTLLTAKKDEKILARIIKQQSKLGFKLQPYAFNTDQLEGFRYRMEDGFRAVTQVAIRETRVKELKQELLATEKLKRHFEENPRDLASLRHDKDLHTARVQQHLKRVPDYLLPESVRQNIKIGFVPFHNPRKSNYKKGKLCRKHSGRKINPLKSFK